MGRLFQILQVVPRVVLPVDDSTLMEHGIVQSCILAVEAGGTDVLLALDGEYEIKCGVVNQESGRDIVMKSKLLAACSRYTAKPLNKGTPKK